MAGQRLGVGPSGLGSPFFTGTAGTGAVDVPYKFDVGLNGRGYMIDTKYIEEWSQSATVQIREQRDSSDEPGEQTLHPDDFWRRSPDGWHGGAGQTALDDPASSRIRFESSKGIDVWTKDRISLLPATDQKRSSANTNLRMVVAGTRLYLIDGNALVYTTDISVDTPSFTTVTAAGSSLSSPTHTASDGHTVWVCDGTATYYTNTASATYNDYHSASHAADGAWYAKSRLWTSIGAALYTHAGTAGSATASLWYTHPNSSWTWVDVAEGTNVVYYAGYLGDKSVIYKSAVEDTGTTMAAPSQAGELPDGEIVRAVTAYLGFVIIGTDKGLRFAAPDTNGDLVIGDLVAMTNPVEAFEPQDRFVWFEWKNYDSSDTGLGRIDLSTFNETSPAYASDLMVAGVQGDVRAIVTFGALTVFTVSGSGVWAEDTDRVASGTIESGELHFGITDDKDAVNLRLRYEPGAGTVQAAVAQSGGSFQNVGGTLTTGTSSGGTVEYATQNVSPSPTFDVRLTLTRDATDTTQSPVISRWSLLADPIPSVRTRFAAPLLVAREVTTNVGGIAGYDPDEIVAELADIQSAGTVVKYQRGLTTHLVRVTGYRWIASELLNEQGGWQINGTLLVEMKDT